MSTMNIVFSADESYAEYLAVAIVSILENNTSNNQIKFYVLTADISKKSREMLEALTRRYKGIKIYFIPIDDRLFDAFPLNIKHITKEAYFRYLIADVLPEIKKALYLDADLLVLGDLDKLWSMDIDNYFIAGSHKEYFAREFPGYKTHIGLKEDDIYINSGVILMNLEKIRGFNKVKALFDNTEKLKGIIKIQDQDIINITFNGGIGNFSNVYNYTESDRKGANRKDSEIVIVHFNTANKPWKSDFQYTNTNKYFADQYQLYRKKLYEQVSSHERA